MGWSPDHKRMKAKVGAPATAAEERHKAWVRQQPCLVSGQFGVTAHHVTGYADRMGRVVRSHRLLVPLAREYHLIQDGPFLSVEALGHRGFYEVHGIDLLQVAMQLEEVSVELGILPDIRRAA